MSSPPRMYIYANFSKGEKCMFSIQSIFFTNTFYSACLLFPFLCILSLYFSFLHYLLKHKLKYYSQRQKQSWALALIPILSGDDCPSKRSHSTGGGPLSPAIFLITLPSCLYLQLSSSLTCPLALLKTHQVFTYQGIIAGDASTWETDVLIQDLFSVLLSCTILIRKILLISSWLFSTIHSPSRHAPCFVSLLTKTLSCPLEYKAMGFQYHHINWHLVLLNVLKLKEVRKTFLCLLQCKKL